MFPTKNRGANWIWTSGMSELLLSVMFGNNEVEDMARQEIVKTGVIGYFKVAPLIVDSFSAFIVNAYNKPVLGVETYRRTHPNEKIMTIRFQCSSELIAKEVMSHVMNGHYDVEFAFYFAGLNQVSTSMVSITGDSLKSVFSKTKADGGNTKATYIHRTQANKFVSSYLINTKKMIFKEDPNSDTSSLTSGLEDQFKFLMQQGMDNSKQEKLNVNAYAQVWSSNDLNPDRLTTVLNKIFTYNQAETNYRNTTDKYYDCNEEFANSLAMSGAYKNSASIHEIASGSLEISASLNKTESGATRKTTQDVISLTDIKKYLDQKSIQTEWQGEKIIPKSFQVYKLTDIIDHLQVALTAIQLTAEKTNHAMIRRMSTLNLPLTFGGLTQQSVIQSSTCMTGEIRLYSAASHPPYPWLFCNGTEISRIQYERLFSVIGESFGTGDKNTTFNLPDFRGRFPLGHNQIGTYITSWKSGGNKNHTLTIDQIPIHHHSAGTLQTTYQGTHTHMVYDPGHNHGGKTGTHELTRRGRDPFNVRDTYDFIGTNFDDKYNHQHDIPTGKTGIIINDNGSHSHLIHGSTTSAGGGNSFSIMPPYQTIAYIIFAGANCA
ncbi:unnamed protein product [Rotaria sp. Silwood1]|nr:unnamed protein product [Rotaria sp. Silwood1]